MRARASDQEKNTRPCARSEHAHRAKKHCPFRGGARCACTSISTFWRMYRYACVYTAYYCVHVCVCVCACVCGYNLPSTQHPQPNELQSKTRAVRRLKAPPSTGQTGKQVGHYACCLVESEHDGNLHRGEALVVGCKQHNHAHRTVRERVEYVAQRDDDKR